MRHAATDAAPAAAPGSAHRHRFETPFWRKLAMQGASRIPHGIQRAAMPLLGGVFYGLVPSARIAVESNLRQVLGDKPGLGNQADAYRLFVNYAQSVANMYSLYQGQGTLLPVEPTFNGRDRLAAAREGGSGIILCTGHLGFWQLGPYLLERSGVKVPVLAMAEEPNAGAQQFEQQFRKRFRIVYTTGSPFASLELASALRQGESVAMQFDRYTGGPHVMLPFFGRPAPFPLGPATLARATGAALVPVFMVREGRRGFGSHVEEPIRAQRTADRAADIRDATARLVAVYESYVRRYPHQWFNFHDFWTPPAGPSLGASEAARPTTNGGRG